MRIPFAILPLLATLTPFTFAYPELVAPPSSLAAGSLSVSWKDNGEEPALSDLTTYTLDLVLGDNDAGPDQAIFPLVTSGTFSSGSTAKGVLSPEKAASTKNGFYFRLTSTGGTGAVISYSDRFTVTGLTGTTPPNMAKAAAAAGTSGPPDNAAGAGTGTQANPAAGAVPVGDESYDTPFNKQSGPMRYAPMQPFPPKKITKKGKPTPQYPTSAFDIATARMPPPTVISTITQSQTVHGMNMENTVAPQAHPKDDMAKFLARWKD